MISNNVSKNVNQNGITLAIVRSSTITQSYVYQINFVSKFISTITYKGTVEFKKVLCPFGCEYSYIEKVEN